MFLHQIMLLLVMLKNIPIFNIFVPIFIHRVFQTLDEVAYVKIIKGKLVTEVIIIRQENEGQFWIIRS